jgi:hypothetical protein
MGRGVVVIAALVALVWSTATGKAVWAVGIGISLAFLAEQADEEMGRWAKMVLTPS